MNILFADERAREFEAFADENAEAASQAMLLKMRCEDLEEQLEDAHRHEGRAQQEIYDLECQLESAEVRAYEAEAERLEADHHAREAEHRAHFAEPGLPHREMLFAHLEGLVGKAERYSRRLALVALELVGADPRVMEMAAERLAHSVRDSDILGRLNDTTFAILVSENTAAESVHHMVPLLEERILESLHHFSVEGRRLYQRIKVRTVIYPDDTSLPSVMMERAELH